VSLLLDYSNLAGSNAHCPGSTWQSHVTASRCRRRERAANDEPATCNESSGDIFSLPRKNSIWEQSRCSPPSVSLCFCRFPRNEMRAEKEERAS